MDLLRVQGRWAASARLGWIRCVLTSEKDVCNGEQSSKSAPTSFPGQNVWDKWVIAIIFYYISNMVFTTLGIGRFI